MFKVLFQIILNLIASLIQVVLFPINTVITTFLPDLSDRIVSVTNTLSNAIGHMSWAIGIIPNSIILTILFVITCEIAIHYIYISTHTLIKVWNVIQKLKFW